jgi:hypothetical protein
MKAQLCSIGFASNVDNPKELANQQFEEYLRMQRQKEGGFAEEAESGKSHMKEKRPVGRPKKHKQPEKGEAEDTRANLGLVKTESVKKKARTASTTSTVSAVGDELANKAQWATPTLIDLNEDPEPVTQAPIDNRRASDHSNDFSEWNILAQICSLTSAKAS